eukprot:307431_1
MTCISSAHYAITTTWHKFNTLFATNHHKINSLSSNNHESNTLCTDHGPRAPSSNIFIKYLLAIYIFIVTIIRNINLFILLSIVFLPRVNAIPSTSPTHAPTTSCLTIYVTVNDPNNIFDATNYNVTDFNGLYTLTNKKQFDRPIYEIPQSPGDRNIQYYFGTNWIINGIGDSNILTLESNEYFPPINNTNVEWTHAAIDGIFYVHMKCIHSFSPTTSPTESPSPSPTSTQPPSFSLACAALVVNVIDAIGFDPADFNGYYTNTGTKWEVIQAFGDKYITYIGAYWSIKAINDTILT